LNYYKHNYSVLVAVRYTGRGFK